MPQVTMRQMLEAGVHFGHQTRYWNPKMGPYIFGARGKIHIINLEKTLPLFNDAMNFISGIAQKRGTILFVGTKRSARESLKEEAIRCGMPYMSQRWLGGTLTNLKTVKRSMKRMKEIERMESDGSINQYVKQEQSMIRREHQRLFKNLDGLRTIDAAPDVMFVIDLKREHNAVAEARRLRIPLVAIVDTNADPDLVDYPIAGNDDAIRSIKVLLQAVTTAIAQGKAEADAKKSRRINRDEPAAPAPAAAPAAAPAPTEAAPVAPTAA